MWAGFAGAAGAIGPIVSGAVLERFWWGSAVLVNLPLVVVAFAAIAVFAPESRDETDSPLDPVGAVLSLVGLSALVFAIIQGGENGWTTTPVVGAIMLMRGLWAGRGVFNVEELPPRPFLEELGRQGLPWYVRDIEASEQAELFAVET